MTQPKPNPAQVAAEKICEWFSAEIGDDVEVVHMIRAAYSEREKAAAEVAKYALGLKSQVAILVKCIEKRCPEAFREGLWDELNPHIRPDALARWQELGGKVEG